MKLEIFFCLAVTFFAVATAQCPSCNGTQCEPCQTLSRGNMCPPCNGHQCGSCHDQNHGHGQNHGLNNGHGHDNNHGHDQNHGHNNGHGHDNNHGHGHECPHFCPSCHNHGHDHTHIKHCDVNGYQMIQEIEARIAHDYVRPENFPPFHGKSLVTLIELAIYANKIARVNRPENAWARERMIECLEKQRVYCSY